MTDPSDDVGAILERIQNAAVGTADIFSIYFGDRLGWYRSLRTDGPATPQELADRTGTHPRYAREWLEQQAVTNLLAVDDSPDAEQRRYTLQPGMAKVLTDETSRAYLGPIARMFAAAGQQLPALLEAYRTGGGVPWEQYGADARESQAEMNRPWYERGLVPALASVPALDAVLRRPGARIADLGCGGGWSSIALARAYPDATVDGFDIDAASVELAVGNAERAGLSDRARFTLVDAAELPGADYDVAFLFECVHDMPHPVEVLSAAARALTPDGFVIVMDEAVAETFTAPGDSDERLMYGLSLLVCLPDSMAHPPSVATGTVMRPETLRGYARDAGLGAFEILPIDDFGLWRFYRLAR
ncbi:MAG: class I SAM-dependent methyltransferase [Jatrophihabitans sp.]